MPCVPGVVGIWEPLSGPLSLCVSPSHAPASLSSLSTCASVLSPSPLPRQMPYSPALAGLEMCTISDDGGSGPPASQLWSPIQLELIGVNSELWRKRMRWTVCFPWILISCGDTGPLMRPPSEGRGPEQPREQEGVAILPVALH